MTLFLAFFADTSFRGDDYLLFSPDFNKTEFFFNIDFPPGALGLLVEGFLIYPLSSPNPKFYLTSLLITSFPLPKILCSLS